MSSSELLPVEEALPCHMVMQRVDSVSSVAQVKPRPSRHLPFTTPRGLARAQVRRSIKPNAQDVALSGPCPVTGVPAVKIQVIESTSSTSTRTPSPPRATFSTSMNTADLVQRLQMAELALQEKDQLIHALEAQVRDAAPAVEQEDLEDGRLSLPGLVDDALKKSEALLRKMSCLDGVDEPELQWLSLMEAHEDHKDRLSQIEALVQRRIESLSPGDPELRVCRAVRGLCIGAQRAPPRRWALTT